ncbi:MAG: excalibur calcium-binding domain-containing protein [Allomuricauda sp.]|uniref:Excalibur calcium-binding domain-containing protein n=1 Tax=Flagellimonas oceani TaxID=2698672 RepID=A0A6G7J7K1_9FLAO|nr:MULTISPECIES: excalibur calcium-binding domain-containing protein [Allomuricauda]MBW8241880.1 excalibur calcium-binding domain-containing protein [Allomuricauda oceani]QII46796.1 hypothetical protein GVT53_19625 [Allomuricauda oceani]
MGYRRGYHKKDGTYVQGHFVSNRSKNSDRKKSKSGCGVLILILAILIASISISCTNESNTPCVKKNCFDFSSRAEAQSTFETNRSCYANLDRDKDGIACEN